MKKWKKVLLDNWALKLVSLIIAFVLWFVVISIDDPVDDKIFTNIRVNLINTELLTDKDKVYEVLEGTNVVRSVSFEAPKSIRDEIEAGDIIAEADFNNMTSTDTVPITFHCPKYGSDVTNISGNIGYVKLNVEEKASKWIDIRYNLIGEVAEGFVVGGVSLDQNRLEIEGPESKIAEIYNAVVDVNVKGISSDMSARADVRLRNAEGNLLNYENVSKTADNVKVSVIVHATKEIPVIYTIMGTPAEGYMATGEIDASPEKVLVAGTASALSNITELVVPSEELDITDESENFVKEINLRRLLTGGINFADKEFNGKAKVTVYIEEIVEQELEISNLNIQIINKPYGRIVDYLKNYEIPNLRIRGLERYVSTVDADSIRGIVDIEAWMAEREMTQLPSGTYQIPVVFELDENVEQVEPVLITLESLTTEEYANRTQSEIEDVPAE